MSHEEFQNAHPAVGVDLASIDAQARRYLMEPGDAAWDDVLRALGGALGESQTDHLLRAIQIRLRTSKRF